MKQSPLAVMRAAQDTLRSALRSPSLPDSVCQNAEAAMAYLATAIELLDQEYKREYGTQ